MIEVRKLISYSVGKLQKIANSEKLGREREGENDIFA